MFNYQIASKKDIQTLVDLNLENLDTYDPRSKKQRDYLKKYLKENPEMLEDIEEKVRENFAKAFEQSLGEDLPSKEDEEE